MGVCSFFYTDVVLYLHIFILFLASPSKTRLDSTTAITEYLMKEGTCKCGLSCPLLVSKTFNFDPEVVSTEWSADSIGNNDSLNSLCNHKWKMIAMATLQTTSILQTASQFTDGQQAASKVLEALSLNKKGKKNVISLLLLSVTVRWIKLVSKQALSSLHGTGTWNNPTVNIICCNTSTVILSVSVNNNNNDDNL